MAHESERTTRKKRIDPKLKASGWEVVPFDASRPLSSYSNHAIEEFSTDDGPADYALIVDGQPLGVVEAKKLTIGAAGVLPQAKRYSKGIDDSPFSYRGFRSPFLFSTNGEVIYFHDVRHELNSPRKIAGFFRTGGLRELLARPAHYHTEALKELKQRPTSVPERFTVDVLQVAQQLRYQKTLVDIISMVKHAAAEQNPLLTAEERAAKAIAQISVGRTCMPEQQQCLERIIKHLAEDLAIERAEFHVIPTLEGAGGWGNTERVFSGKLSVLVGELNKAIAA